MLRQIILASTSPRRREMMQLLKIPFKAVDSGYEEVHHKHLAHPELVKFLALGKAKAAAKKYPKAIIIAADTLVSFKGEVLGKPKTKEEAVKMLSELSGTKHKVFSGMAVIDASKKIIISGHDTTTVWFKKLSQKDIQAYINSGEAMDKAGAYGPIGKGLNLIKKIEGDSTTQFGMSLMFVSNALLKLSVKI